MDKKLLQVEDIPRKKIKISCTASTPAQLTPELLSEELHNIGLTCEYTDPKVVAKLINQVEKRLPNGENEAFGIYVASGNDVNLSSHFMSEFQPTLERPFLGADKSVDATWKPSQDALGYMGQLSSVLAQANFTKLKEHFTDFVYYEKPKESTTKNETTVAAITDFFADTLATASNSMIDGIDVEDMKAVCTQLLQPMLKEDDTYTISSTFVIFLLKNYHDDNADSIGGVALDWSLEITNYKNKKESKHETKLTLAARSTTYDDVAILDKHTKFLSNSICSLVSEMYEIPPKTHTVEIFKDLPTPSYDTFYKGIPQLNTGGATVDALILYTANLDEMGIIDNSTSDASCSYSISLTTGFTNSESISVGEELYMEAGCDILKVGAKITLSATFTKETSKSHSETITYEVPAKTIAHLYQGFIQYAVLSMNLTTGALRYSNKGKYMTNLIKTSPTPLLSL